MHQSFATTSHRGPGNSGDIGFFHMQSPGKIPALKVLFFGQIPAKSPRPRGITSKFMGIEETSNSLNLLQSRTG